jgi:hypothetical protein
MLADLGLDGAPTLRGAPRVELPWAWKLETGRWP